MRRREDYAAALDKFAAHEADIMLGTQMVAKGLDFPDVRLVGVIDADAALSMPDFRAPEVVFQLLMQVVGRAGRKEGESLAVVQTRGGSNPILRAAARMDYEAFAELMLPIRQRMFDPPYCQLARLICLDPDAARARHEASALALRLRKLATRTHAELRVADAEPCVIPRLREMFRYHILLRGPQSVALGSLLRTAETEKLLAPRVKRFTIDIDPMEML